MSKIFIYAQVDALDPPTWLHEQVLNKLNNLGDDQVKQLLDNNQFRLPNHIDGRGSEYTDRILNHPAGSSMSAFTNTMFFDKSATDWAKNNITSLAKNFRYNCTTPGRPRCGPHIDFTRSFTMLYLLQSGGDDHQTVFYREKGQQLIRPNGYHVDDYDQLKEIVSIKVPLNQWIVLNATLLHSVENITNGRRSFQISLDTLDPDLKLINPLYIDDI